MKSLNKLTKKEAQEICKLIDQPFLSYHVYSDEDRKRGLTGVMISTETTLNKQSEYDGYIMIHENGEISLTRNDGGWRTGSNEVHINTLPIIDYLRMRGYDFIYPQLRRIKLMGLKK